ncbi:hypothetical protein DFAR_2210084 [Desulfarculales bacterium]
MEKLSREQSLDMLEVLEDRYGRGSTIITAQVPVDQWYETISDPTLANAILDRLIHNAYKINLKGESMRKKLTSLAGDKTPVAIMQTSATPCLGHQAHITGLGAPFQMECMAHFSGLRRLQRKLRWQPDGSELFPSLGVRGTPPPSAPSSFLDPHPRSSIMG